MVKRKKEKERLAERKKEIVNSLPPFGEVLRGTFIKVRLECIRPRCKCHRDKKYRHGPYYRVSYGKGKRVHHIYVPLAWKEKAKGWTRNYQKVWDTIEKISALNIKLLKTKG
jgi:hypothetical protein